MFKIYAAIAVSVAALVAAVAIGYLSDQKAAANEGQSSIGIIHLPDDQALGATYQAPPHVPIPPFAVQIPDNGESEWVPVFFIRDPDQIPAGPINPNFRPLGRLGQVGPGGFGASPATLLLEGISILPLPVPLQGQVPEGYGPLLVNLQNPVGVVTPVWFVSREDFDDASNSLDGLTMTKLRNMNSLVEASATHLVYLASGGAPVPKVQISATGVLNAPAGHPLAAYSGFSTTLIYIDGIGISTLQMSFTGH